MSGPVGNNPYRASGVVAAAAGGGAVSWCSTVKTAAFCAESGKGYFVDTCGGGITATLPASASSGDEINFTDYARTWGTACKELTLNQGGLNFQGSCCPNPEYDTEGATVKIVYADATQGWIPQLDKGTELETPQTYSVQYLVVAGGGGGGAEGASTTSSGGAGAGGMRLVCSKSFLVSPATTYPITVGGGGAGGIACGSNPERQGTKGEDSVFSTITSTGGGFGSGTPVSCTGAGPGGSGGGAKQGNPCMGGPTYGVGVGNDPPVSPSQGNPGGQSDGGPAAPAPKGTYQAGGGGGHACAGLPGGQAFPGGGGPGGDGTVTGIRGAPFDPVAYGGGGGGGESQNSSPTNRGAAGTGGAGGGGAGGGSPRAGSAGGTNTGGGGGGASSGPPGGAGGLGGSGIVVIRRLTSSSCSTSGTVTTCGADTIHTFLADGCYAA